ncbi:MAG: flagellar biosynthesis anti-sigma factor FlgM [Clostridia bacterium]|nr:flagellar biosynthesis anti-sigma factor FlgM [Deltaproteobacteria bacterium]
MNRTVISKDAPVRSRWTAPVSDHRVSDHRAARIARLRGLVASGSYKVDLFALADRLIDNGILEDIN